MLRLAPTLAAVLLLAAGCGSPGARDHFSRHFDGEIWHEAHTEQLGHAERVIPELGLLLSLPIIAATDDEISEDAVPGYVTDQSPKFGDALAIALGAGVVGIGIVDGTQGDWGPFEIGAESLAATAAFTEILKVTTHRERPDGSANDSFPSGHASFAFASATFIARYVEEYADESWSWAGYLAYGPAIYVGISRVENQRHYTTDVIFGALLGMVLTNWIYDAHHAPPGSDRPTIENGVRKVAWQIAPVVDGSEVSLALRVSL